MILRLLALLSFGFFATSALGSTVFVDDFRHVETPGMLVGTDIPDTRPVLMWDGSPLLDIISYESNGGVAVFNDTTETGSGPAFVVHRNNPNRGVELSNFRISVDVLYFDTLSNGGNNFGRINYFINQFHFNPGTGSNIGYSLEYRFRVDGSNGFESRLLFNDGNGPVLIEGSEVLVEIPLQRNANDKKVPGRPIRLILDVVDGQHSLAINGNEAFSVQHHSRQRSGYFNIIPVNNRNNGFSNVKLETL